MSQKARTPGNFGNGFMATLLRSPLHGFISKSMMLITVTGRKSGKTYSTPVNYLRSGDMLITTSYRERSWWRNLRGGAQVTVRVQGKDLTGQGEVIEDAAGVSAALAEYFRLRPGYARFFGVKLGADGQPDPDDLARATQTRVVVKIHLA
jgi:deazaflavin-dependent oxidoreductase (nitroreductase family)